jgi:predicted ATPase
MLVTFRPEFRLPWGVRSYLTHLTLGRLPRQQVALMIERVAGGKSLPAEVVSQLIAKSDGVPLFVEELTRMTLESGVLKELHGQYELAGAVPTLAIPTTLHASLTARLDRLGSAKQVAQLGAVIGREFPYELLQALAPVDQVTLQRELTRLVDAELLHQRGLPPAARYLFKHALLQEAAYASLLRSTRRQMHDKIARVLEERFADVRETQPELLGHHYSGAGLHREAIAYWHQAGLRATERSAYVEAVAHLRQGLDMLDALPDTNERVQQELLLLVAVGAPLTALKGYAAPEVERAYARARELCKRLGDTPQLFPVLHGLVRFYLVRGELQTARELAEECLTLAQRVQDPALLLEAQGHLGVTLFYSGELAPAQSLLEQVRQLYHAEQHRAHAFLYGQEPGVSCYGYLSIVLWLRGYPTQARQCCHDMLALAQAQAHPYSLTFASFLATWLYQMCGDLAGMSQHAKTTMALAAEHGFPLLLGMGQRFWGWGLVEQGQADEGLRQMTAGMAAFRLTGAETALTYTQVRLAEAYQRTHRLAEARQALNDAVRAMAKGERFYTAEVYRLQGEFALSAGGREAALRAADWWHRAIEVAQQQQARALELRAVISLTRLWQQQGKRRQAYQRLAESYDGFTEGFDTADLQAAQALLEELR